MDREHLQIVCFKLLKTQLEALDDLVLRRLYFSRSEILRIAIRGLLKKLTEEKILANTSRTGRYITPYCSSFSSSANLGSGTSCKDSISSKMPLNLLEVIDSIVAQEYFESRSHLIREAVSNFLDCHKSMHDAFDA
ncbi:MAG: ribbon-helix-helix domain-containing protein [Candidatus Odinarchaeota archaeon]